MDFLNIFPAYNNYPIYFVVRHLYRNIPLSSLKYPEYHKRFLLFLCDNLSFSFPESEHPIWGKLICRRLPSLSFLLSLLLPSSYVISNLSVSTRNAGARTGKFKTDGCSLCQNSREELQCRINLSNPIICKTPFKRDLLMRG